jgi:hypothetical protein
MQATPGVQGVVHVELTGQVLPIVGEAQAVPHGDGLQVAAGLHVGAVHDLCQAQQHPVGQAIVLDDGLERALAVVVAQIGPLLSVDSQTGFPAFAGMTEGKAWIPRFCEDDDGDDGYWLLA